MTNNKGPMTNDKGQKYMLTLKNNYLCASMKICALFILVTILSACQTVPQKRSWQSFSEEVAKIAAQIRKGEPAGVSYIYEAKTGNITELGNLWRDRIEKALRDHGVKVKARRDIVTLIDDAESHGLGKAEKEIWQQAGAEVIVCGNYRVLHAGGSKAKDTISLHFKAFRVADSTLLKTVIWEENLERSWPSLASAVRGHAFHRKMETVTDEKGKGSKPNLSARLDRDPPCYPPETPATVHVFSEPGVHLYLLGLAADRTVTLLYPNSKLPDQPLTSGKFDFPPKALGRDLQLVFRPLKEGEPCQESIKVVASRTPLDFSFLPVPENRIYIGAEGGDIKRMLEVLQRAGNWQEVVLNYIVGPGCE